MAVQRGSLQFGPGTAWERGTMTKTTRVSEAFLVPFQAAPRIQLTPLLGEVLGYGPTRIRAVDVRPEGFVVEVTVPRGVRTFRVEWRAEA